MQCAVSFPTAAGEHKGEHKGEQKTVVRPELPKVRKLTCVLFGQVVQQVVQVPVVDVALQQQLQQQVCMLPTLCAARVGPSQFVPVVFQAAAHAAAAAQLEEQKKQL